MNLILLTNNDFLKENIVKIKTSRIKHILEIHRPALNKKLIVGLLNGKKGKGEIIASEDTSIIMKINLNEAPPTPIPITLIVALPRPKTLKKVLQVSTSIGVKNIIFIESWKVDKSYWNSPALQHKEVEKNCILGLEQSKDTILPKVSFYRRFKPFIEDLLPKIIENSIPLIAHPYNAFSCPTGMKQHVTLAIGPEGGFTDYEINSFKEAGFKPITLGERILRIEFAIPSLISKIF